MNDKSNLIIAFQGVAGAYSNMACEAYFPNSETLPCTSFEDMLNSLTLNSLICAAKRKLVRRGRRYGRGNRQ